MSNAAQGFRTVRALLADRSRWTKGTVARDRFGNPTNPFHPDACQFCLEGACQLISHGQLAMYDHITTLLLNAASEFFPDRNIEALADINDEMTTTHDDILKIIAHAQV